jgi:hypothetical protein
MRYVDEKWAPFKEKDSCVLMISIDVYPYYFTKIPEGVDMWYIVGNNYPTLPGVYQHLDGGGSYCIYSDDNAVVRVRNKPSGTSSDY